MTSFEFSDELCNPCDPLLGRANHLVENQLSGWTQLERATSWTMYLVILVVHQVVYMRLAGPPSDFFTGLGIEFGFGRTCLASGIGLRRAYLVYVIVEYVYTGVGRGRA